MEWFRVHGLDSRVICGGTRCCNCGYGDVVDGEVEAEGDLMKQVDSLVDS